MIIIGLSGKSQSGKSTIAEYLCRQYAKDYLVVIMGFAYAVKWEFMDETAYGRKIGKPFNAITDLDLQEVKDRPYIDGTIRDRLVQIGLERRAEDPDYFVKKWQSLISDDIDILIVPDVRFPNEVKAIQDMGGVVIRLTKCPIKSDNLTETALDKNYQITELFRSGSLLTIDLLEQPMFDYVIDNSQLCVDETNKRVHEIMKGLI